MSEMVKRKLIEVALPLEAINKESAREKSIRHGHPSTLHLWWARRPLATCRAVLFASLVDDPSSNPEKFPTAKAQEEERERLFGLIERLVKWENSTSQQVLGEAKAEIVKSAGSTLPAVMDLFCGGGSIPLEAQRLGLEAVATDLNPVAVLITKAMIEIPARFCSRHPVHPIKDKLGIKNQYRGAKGLSEDIQFYGEWMRSEAFKRIGHLYPKVELEKGGQAMPIAWLWVRTIRCPNPACAIQMPLVRTLALSTKKGRECWVEPVLVKGELSFKVRKGIGKATEGTVNRRGARCIACQTPVGFEYVRQEGKSGRISAQLMAIVCEGDKGRVYLDAQEIQSKTANSAKPTWHPEADLPHNPRDFKTPNYGLRTFSELFTPRQLVALTTLSDLIQEVRGQVLQAAIVAGYVDDKKPLSAGGAGAEAYADAVATYLAFAVDKATDYWSSLCSWHSSGEKMRNTFGRQALPMVWDYAECCPFSSSTGSWMACVDWVWKVVAQLPAAGQCSVEQKDATEARQEAARYIVSTDPPYYDNIGYADLSDFFYIWLRRSIGKIFPALFSTMLVPKTPELVATPYRFGGDKTKAKEFFENGLMKAFSVAHSLQDRAYPFTVYYAFKQAESEEEETELGDEDEGSNNESVRSSTGWESMLEALLQAGFSIHGTWPVRSELSNRQIATGKNALASSIVLVCRPRDKNAPRTTRREFVGALKRELPLALRTLQHGLIAPVDLAQAAIGPGMAVFSRYFEVSEADGTPMSVRSALQVINKLLDEVLSEQDSDYDSDTRWAVAWFDQFGFSEGQFGVAEVLSKAKDTALGGLVEAGIVESRAGKVRLYRRDELGADWDPSTDTRLTIWEITHYLIRALEEGGITKAAELLKKVGAKSETAQELAYRLYGICEKKKWAQEALAYNSLVVSWSEIKGAAGQVTRQLQTTEI